MSFQWDKVPVVDGHKVFIPSEFDDPNYPGSGVLIDSDTVRRLIALRLKTGWPIVIHSSVGGAVDVDGTHGHAQRSYHRKDRGCKAVDWHFLTDASQRNQFYEVMLSGFTGIGVYYDWWWNGHHLPIGFHTDTRPKSQMQIWTRVDGVYTYFLL